MGPVDRDQLVIIAIILSVSVVIAYNYFNFVERPNISPRMELHDSILGGDAPSPYRYRLLVPALTEGTAKAIRSTGILSYRKSWIISYIIYDLAAVSLFLLTFFYFLRIWHGELLSLLGVLACAGLLPLALRDHYYQPWSLIEAWFFCSAMLAAHSRSYPVLIVITAAAALNRATGLFIPLIYLFGAFGLRQEDGPEEESKTAVLLKFMVLTATGLATVLLTRYFLGFAGNIHSLGELWNINTSFPGLAEALVNLALFGGVWWLFFAAGIKYADRFTRSLLLFLPIYAVPVVLFGVWKEVRLLMPAYPVIISTGIFYLRNRVRAFRVD